MPNRRKVWLIMFDSVPEYAQYDDSDLPMLIERLHSFSLENDEEGDKVRAETLTKLQYMSLGIEQKIGDHRVIRALILE